jgi:hypothetical protein
VAPCFSTISKTATEFIEVFTYPSLPTVEDGLEFIGFSGLDDAVGTRLPTQKSPDLFGKHTNRLEPLP